MSGCFFAGESLISPERREVFGWHFCGRFGQRSLYATPANHAMERSECCVEPRFSGHIAF
jgi:hypothetical protein